MYIIPRPQNLEGKDGVFTVAYQGRIVIGASCEREVFRYAKLLTEEIRERLGYLLPITRGEFEPGCIYLEQRELRKEEYILSIRKDGIRIGGGDSGAILYGVQTLRQLIAGEGACLHCLEIRDYPEIPNRGYYMDATRGRIPTLAFLKTFADKLSYYKINQLQLYIEHSFLFKELSEVWRDDTPLTAEEILELDEYCRELHIELVPSMASFGHLHKLLTTKTYSHLCELDNAEGQPFSFEDRMIHHTIDPTNEDSLKLIKRLIDEYVPLFSSDQFNLCADETFDLGKGRSKAAVERTGLDSVYIGYVKSLSEYLLQKGKRPMFWGDIICGFPEAISQLPKEMICLNWGYDPDQSEDSTRQLHQAGAVQYICPGVSGWNRFINRTDFAYENIKRMCTYAHKYHALGVLNTDWGDFGHVNHPEFSLPGMIYGAAFSWNREIPDYDELNRQISALEYGDSTETFVEVTAALAQEDRFEWYHIVRYLELYSKQRKEAEKENYLAQLDLSTVKEANLKLQANIQKLYELLPRLEFTKRRLVKSYLVAAEGIQLFNSIGATLSVKLLQSVNEATEPPKELAVRLECWFYHYKELWRTVSKESELYRLQDLILGYADLLRNME